MEQYVQWAQEKKLNDLQIQVNCQPFWPGGLNSLYNGSCTHVPDYLR